MIFPARSSLVGVRNPELAVSTIGLPQQLLAGQAASRAARALHRQLLPGLLVEAGEAMVAVELQQLPVDVRDIGS